VGERRRAFLWVSPLLGPLPARSSQGEDGEFDAALSLASRLAIALYKALPCSTSIADMGCFSGLWFNRDFSEILS